MNPYLSEIRFFTFNFAPLDWAACDGQLLAIGQFSALFSLLGTNYGGNGTSNFQLPNLQGQTLVHFGQGQGLSPYVVGEVTGTESVTLDNSTTPVHSHTPVTYSGSTNRAASPQATLALSSPEKTRAFLSKNPSPTTTMHPSTLTSIGGTAHENRQPFLVMNACIAMSGVFPARN